MSTIHVITEASMALPMASDDLIGFTGQKINEVGVLLRAASVVIAVGFVIVQAFLSRMALSRVVISGLVAGLLVWIVFNVTNVKERFDNEFNGAPVQGNHALLEPADG
ncbi:hypothetical protein ACFVBP_10510 [Nocardioides sp. NPDC057764]|uniref:hypothetical protein n=1 Tax=Nocardioides sp. NPDC057764 TaxID=3346243 RepID=UPI00366AF7E5